MSSFLELSKPFWGDSLRNVRISLQSYKISVPAPVVKAYVENPLEMAAPARFDHILCGRPATLFPEIGHRGTASLRRSFRFA